MEVALLTHRGGNLGHELMAVGVERVVRAAFPRNSLAIAEIEQHDPFDVYSRWSPARALNLLTLGSGGLKGRIAGAPGGGRLLELRSTRAVSAARIALSSPKVARVLWRVGGVRRFDLAVECGGPVIRPSMHRDSHLGLERRHLPGAVTSRGARLASLAVGSAFPLERASERLGVEDEAFLRSMLAHSSVTTARDAVAQRLCAAAGVQCELLPCTAVFATPELEPGETEARHVLVNYQERGANEDWGQAVDADAWRAVLRELVDRLRRRHQVAFLCQSEPELRLAARLDSSVPVFTPRSAEEYAALARRAKAALVSRIHAGVPLGGAGVPCVGVGTDTRLGALETLGFPCFYVKEATPDLLEEQLETAIENGPSERVRLLELRRRAFARYLEIVQATAQEGPR